MLKLQSREQGGEWGELPISTSLVRDIAAARNKDTDALMLEIAEESNRTDPDYEYRAVEE
jgi:hypothetical protein